MDFVQRLPRRVDAAGIAVTAIERIDILGGAERAGAE